MKNVKHFTQKYIDWVIKLGRIKFSLLGFTILSSFALCTQILLSVILLGEIHWRNLLFSVIFGLISAPFVIYFFTVLVEKLELSRQDLAQSIQDKSTLLATISHELRTPLNGILGLSQMLLDTNLTEQQRKYLNTISMSAVSLGHIFSDIIDLEKIDGLSIELYQTETDFFHFLADMENMATLMCTQKNLQFEMKCGANLPSFLMLDRTRLSQILWNLLNNAVKFTEKGKISLSVEKGAGNQYRFVVQDTGLGIAAHELEKIFELYYQGQSGAKKAAGTGIGLAISRNIAHLMNGDLRANSELGQGSTFTLLIEADSVETKASELPPSAVQNLQVLLIEDIQLNVVVAKALLEKLGCQVDVAMSGQEAMEAFAQHNYDLVLLDIQLPDMTGFELAQYWRSQYENDQVDYLPPLIALTANVMQNKAEYQARGLDDVLRKPLMLEDLLICLNDYCGLPETDRLPVQAEVQLPTSLAHYFDLELLEDLLSFISPQTYAQNVELFAQSTQNGGELDMVTAYQDYQQQRISAQQLGEVAHKVKGAAASLAMKLVQEKANLAQHVEQEEWQAQIENWVAEIERDIQASLAQIQDWLTQNEQKGE